MFEIIVAIVTTSCYNINMKLTKEQKELFSKIGRLGGKANAKKGKKYMSELGKKGALVRWGKLKTNKK